MTFEELAEEIERLAERVDRMRHDGGVFWIDLYGPVPADFRNLPDCAAAAYGKTTLVTGVRQVRAKDWKGRLGESFRARAGFAGQAPHRVRRDLAFEIDWLCEMVTEAIGPIRSAATVDHAPKSWYAALWEDWLLVGEEWAVVVSLINDS